MSIARGARACARARLRSRCVLRRRAGAPSLFCLITAVTAFTHSLAIARFELRNTHLRAGVRMVQPPSWSIAAAEHVTPDSGTMLTSCEQSIVRKMSTHACARRRTAE